MPIIGAVLFGGLLLIAMLVGLLAFGYLIAEGVLRVFPSIQPFVCRKLKWEQYKPGGRPVYAFRENVHVVSQPVSRTVRETPQFIALRKSALCRGCGKERKVFSPATMRCVTCSSPQPVA